MDANQTQNAMYKYSIGTVLGRVLARTGLTDLGLFFECRHFDFWDSVSGPIGVSF